MAEHVEILRRTLRELIAERERLDADIRDLNRIISRYGGNPSAPTVRRPGKASPPGEGKRHVLELMADGSDWTAGRLAKARGTSANAANAMLKRLARDGLLEPGRTGFRLASPKGDDAEDALSDERDGQRSVEEVTQ